MATLLPATALAVRWLHLLAVAVLLGGATLAWWLLGREAADPVATGRAYERLFWLAAGVVVLTGVGNAGALAPAVPDPGTGRGGALLAKLLAVAGLLVLSAARTLVVVVLDSPGAVGVADVPDAVEVAGGPAGVATVDADRARRLVRAGYAATGLYLAGLVALGAVVAHG